MHSIDAMIMPPNAWPNSTPRFAAEMYWLVAKRKLAARHRHPTALSGEVAACVRAREWTTVTAAHETALCRQFPLAALPTGYDDQVPAMSFFSNMADTPRKAGYSAVMT
ncbi:hypothetical protein [Janthinobacterium tructae]|uniref:Uncharacterized protein n=1 Tax=Janthinobacterium tructae TaxID=2590869 RepID=A0A4Y6RCD3_9BURK|nr:hypothetical protein [Janthinobacterium tructae]QDG70144.1 hypothetical protein FJQ89_06710 [Janthinobacterium tructae]